MTSRSTSCGNISMLLIRLQDLGEMSKFIFLSLLHLTAAVALITRSIGGSPEIIRADSVDDVL